MAGKRKTRATGGAPAPDVVPKQAKKRVKITSTQKGDAEQGRVPNNWRTYFLQALAETSNITVSAERAGISPSRAYKARREDAAFASRWRGALLEGYDYLELALLAHLRNPDPALKFDTTAALRALSRHADTVAMERARTDPRDKQTLRASIDAMLDQMRERAKANAVIVAETAGKASDAAE